MRTVITASWLIFGLFAGWSHSCRAEASSRGLLTGRSALTDFRGQHPGTIYPPGPNPRWVYVGNTDSVVRFEYKNGASE